MYVLQIVENERNILQAIKIRKVNCIGHILHRICLLKQVTVGRTEEDEDVSSKWTNLRKTNDNRN
jgi:hypothetical protein